MARKMVRAVRNGFWEGHRRRAGAVFSVDAKAKEQWFVDVGPAPADDAPPEQLLNGQAPPARTFVGAMEKIAQDEKDRVAAAAQPVTLAEVQHPDEGADLV